MRRFAGFVVRRRRAVILFWVVLLLVTATIGSSAFSVLSTDFGAGTSTESGRVSQALDDMAETGGQLAIVADGVDIDDPSVQAAVAKGLAPIAELDGVISVVDPWSTGIDELKATDGRAALVVVTLSGDLDDEEQTAVAGRVEDLAHEVDAPEILVGGNVLVSETFAEASEADLLRGEAIALPIAIIVMVILLGGLVAAGMPLLVAIGGVFTTLAVLVAATYFGDVSIFSVNVVNMLGIGLGIDYGLLMVNRFREERGHGVELHEAVVNTVSSAGTTVVFSAFTVAVAMSGLFVFGVPLLTSFGIAGLSVVLLSMLAAVSLLPATLASVGGRIKPSAPVPDAEGRFYRLTRWVQARPVAVGGAAALVLVLLGIPFLSARFENGDARALPRSSEVRATALLLADRFPARGADPVTVIADTDAKDPAFVTWLASVTGSGDVVGHSIREGTPDGTTVVDLVAKGTSQGAAATSVVDRIRSSDTSFAKQVGGPAAELIDVKDKLSSRLPYAAALVCLATLLLLFLMTGSIIVPIKAVLMNILSLCASFGAMVWIFQEGHLSGPLGFTSVGALDLWMPVLILIFAFGLSMDYEVFLLSRIKEVHDETGDNDLAVAVGLQRSGRIITSAALLLSITFFAFATSDVTFIKLFGLGLAIAVLVDAFIVRSLLVPSLMKLAGDWNWWAPGPMRRFHDRFGISESEVPVESGVPVGSDAR